MAGRTIDAADRGIAALAHPLRGRILELVAELGEASPRYLAVALDAPLATVSYHVRELLKARMLRQSRTEQRRGAVAHFYRLSRHAAPALEAVQFRAAALRGSIDGAA